MKYRSFTAILRRTVQLTASWCLALTATFAPAIEYVDQTFTTSVTHPTETAHLYTTCLQADGKLILGGRFAKIDAVAAGNVGRLPGTAADFNPGTGPNGAVLCTAVQDDGKVLIAGQFTAVNGSPRGRIARLNPDGSVESTGTFDTGAGADGDIYAMTIQPDGQVLVCGQFISFAGQPRGHIVRLNPNGSLDSTFHPASGANDTIYTTVVQPDGRILIGGLFTSYDGQPRNRLARLNIDGTPETAALFNPGTGANGGVFCFALYGDGHILAGGSFTTINGASRNRLARLNPNGTLESTTTFNPGTGLNGVVNSIALNGDGIAIAAGDFSTANGQSVNRLVKIYQEGTMEEALAVGPNGPVLSLMINNNGKAIFGGDFTQVTGLTRNHIAAFGGSLYPHLFTVPAPDRILWTRRDTLPVPSVATFDVSTDGGTVWTRLGTGSYTSSGWELTGLNLSGAGIIRVHGRVPCGYHNGSSGIIEQFLYFNSAVPDPAFNPNVVPDETYGGVVGLTVQPDEKIVICGGFKTVNGQARNGIARLSADGILEGPATFNPGTGPGAGGTPYCLAVQPDLKVLVSGVSTRWSGRTTFSQAVRLGSNGVLEAASAFNVNLASGGLLGCTLVQPDGKVVFGGGSFSGGVLQEGIIRVNANGTAESAATWSQPSIRGFLLCTLRQPDGKILIGGRFTQVNGQTRNSIARLNANGSLESSSTFNTSGLTGQPSDLVQCMALQPDGKILVGGTWTSFSGQARMNLVRLNSNGTLESTTTFNPGTGPDSMVQNVLLQTDGKIILSGYFQNVDGKPFNRLARLQPDGKVESVLTFNPGSGASDVVNAALQANGNILMYGSFKKVNGVDRNSIARMLNGPASDSLTAASRSRVRWMRGGTAPEITSAGLELSVNGGAAWTPLATPVRVAGGWETTGLNLPLSGQLRARGRTADSRNEGIIQSVTAFELLPEIALHDGDSTGAPELTDGQTEAIVFATVRASSPQAAERRFTVANTGNAPLVLSVLSLPPGYSLTNPVPLPATLAEGAVLTFSVQLSTAAAGTFAGSIVITSNDRDEALFDFPITGAVVTPEIAVYDGSGDTTPELSDGQTAAVEFGIVRQGTPRGREITIANNGTAPLLLAGFSVPSGFEMQSLSPLPAAIEAGASLILQLSAVATAQGTFGGLVTIRSDDLDEADFTFPVTVTIVTPEIGVYDGAVVTAPELSAGQATVVSFGRNVQGTPGTRSFTIANTGTVRLLVTSVTVPPGYTALNLPELPLLVGINESATFQISLTTLIVATHAGSVMIASDDLDEALFDFPVTGEVFIPDPVSSVVSTTTTLNRQTGLREQTLHITNDTTATVPAYNLIIRGLPAGVEVNNASETRADGSVVVYIRQGMAPHSVQDIVIEYYSPTRAPTEISPQLSTEVILNPPDLTVPAGTGGLAIENVRQLTGGEMLLEFTSTSGQRYEVQYSGDGLSWQASLPPIRAAANRTQWIDRGLPRTDRHPSLDGTRLYRVREIAP